MRPGKIRAAWDGIWPDDVEPPEWDALGRVQMGKSGCWEWLYVQAVSSLDELTGDCPARSAESKKRIGAMLSDVKQAVGAPPTADWLHGYYHHAISLWVRRFLQSNGICGRTLFIYFVDEVSADRDGVPTQVRWNAAIDTMERHLGLTGKSVLERRVYKLFFPTPAGQITSSMQV